MGGVLTTVDESRDQVYRIGLFSSRTGMPDYLAFNSQGGLAIGFFGNQWEYEPAFGSAR